MLEWIDKKIEVLKENSLFQKFFAGYELEEIEREYYLTNSQEGIGIVLNSSKKLVAIHLYSNSMAEEVLPFTGILPFNLNFSFDLKKVHSLLGQGGQKGGDHSSLYVGYINYWEKYFFEYYTLHIKYSKEKENILMITLGSLSIEKYLKSSFQ